LLSRQTDGDHNAFQILHHIIVGESEHSVSARREPLVTTTIVTQTRFKIMALAINLNDELAGMRDEVRDIAAHWALTTKSESGKPMGFQMTPQQSFGARHRPP
jgi:hypothetical protein